MKRIHHIFLCTAALGCAVESRSEIDSGSQDIPASDAGTGELGEGTGSSGSQEDDTEAGDSLKLDVGFDTDGDPDCAEGGCDEDECAVPEHQACDASTDDLLQAIGLNCPGELVIEGSVTGSPQASEVRQGFGATQTWAPREGSAFAVLGTGMVADLDIETPNGDPAAAPMHCNDDLGPQFDPGLTLPAPLRPEDVAGDCAATPSLVGTGDCSNTIQKQWSQGVAANDYMEIRIETTVPAGSSSLSYDFAFLSTEYPYYYFSEFNDMFVGWLESENWTGNVSFDDYGNPISLNASFLDFKDNAGNLPELAGTCMRTHAATKWLTTTAPVSPGEDITLVLAVFDLSDSILDSYVFVDNFQWGCEGGGKPSTVPVG